MGKKYNLSKSLNRMQKESLMFLAGSAGEPGIPKPAPGTVPAPGSAAACTLTQISENSGFSPNKLLGCDNAEAEAGRLVKTYLELFRNDR